ncbi:endonuclease/exonuclease/phosphatase family protein [Leptospira interrogans]|uniref:endonuclease/exonuclease/phosphatase family protein n=1 Tax=Leptospira interrogans TaxID=173 RepID=UPI00027858BB|nr:endonuclease/exonuclease/phosphatase family protein [Leptospira interrogans]EJP16617.1 hypothetical protein LEP1GSC080_0646 [Leptospira interrogans str. FPW2026]
MKSISIYLSYIILFLFNLSLNSEELSIITWNIRNLGNCKLIGKDCTKNKKDIIKDIHFEISKVFKNQDLIFIQELSTNSSVDNNAINSFVKTISSNMKWFVSKNVGNSSGNRERLLVIYNPEKLTYEYHSYIDKNCIIRSPLIIKFKELPIYFITTHITAKKESIISELSCIERNIGYNSFVLLGDTNADCNYYPRTKVDISNMVFKNSNWLILTGEDTTISSKTNCTYDRIIGSKNIQFNDYSVYKNFKGDERFQLRISDHYPINFRIEY